MTNEINSWGDIVEELLNSTRSTSPPLRYNPPASLQEKPKTPRKRTKKEEKVDNSPYNIIVPSLQGLISDIPINHKQAGPLFISNNRRGGTPFTMSIYSEYIPIMMLRYCNPNIVPLNSGLNSNAKQLFQNKDKIALNQNNYHLLYLLNMTVDYSSSSDRRDRDTFRNHLKGSKITKLLEEHSKLYYASDGEISLSYLKANTKMVEKEEGLPKFTNFTYGQGLLNVRVGQPVHIDTYSMFYGDKPLIVATCLPENYVYHRLRLLLGLPLDLTRVIIFIDKALESPDYPHKSVQKYYYDMLLPEILKTSCIIAKVPTWYIDTKCFVEKFSIDGQTPMEINAKKDELKKSFLSYLLK